MTDTAVPPAVDRDSIRAGMEAARAGFHELLDSLSPEEFKKKSGNASWSNGQLCWHMAWAIDFIPRGVQRARTGKNLNLPRGVYNIINPWLVRWGSRGITPDKVSRLYDEAHARMIAAFDSVKDDEWTKGAKIAGTYETVADHFKIPAEHLAEHKADVLKSLGRV